MINNSAGPSPAEKSLSDHLLSTLRQTEKKTGSASRILNIGAGKRVVIENRLVKNEANFICDRIDIGDCTVNHKSVDKCLRSSVEKMPAIESDIYDAAFANFVMEHVPDLRLASREIFRVLKPNGRFIATVPNVLAPEFCFAKITPLWFHKLLQRENGAFETYYSYRSIDDLTMIFESSGFKMIDASYSPCAELYLSGVSALLGRLGRFYDKTLIIFRMKRLMGNVCMVFEKSA